MKILIFDIHLIETCINQVGKLLYPFSKCLVKDISYWKHNWSIADKIHKPQNITWKKSYKIDHTILL